jgi:hypothetical protein
MELAAPEYDDTKDIGNVLALLPIFSAPDSSRHHLDVPKYRSEVISLLECLNGAYPGTPMSQAMKHKTPTIIAL